ncbi:MAG: hypothetical protein M1833_001134 [Piccolia ochrophora]|nr:MAG: hypothetical protein M1833_001134 [Piccolia ochrophora]
MRLDYVPDPPPTSNATDAEIVARVRQRRSPQALQPLDLTLLHSPPVADGWNSFLGAIRSRTSLPSDIRELAICRVAVLNNAWYEWTHHMPIARQAGVSDAGIDSLKNGNGEELTEAQQAVVQFTDEMTKHVEVRESVFDSLRTHFTQKEIVEITATVSAYNCVSRFLVALDVGEMNQ